MLAAIFITGIIVLVSVSAVRRLSDLKALVWPVWPLLIVSCVMPAAIGYQTLQVATPIDSAIVRELGDAVQLDVPEGYAIMATATLVDIDPDEPNAGKTDYSLSIQGKNWQEPFSGTIKRKVDRSGPDVDLAHGQGIRETGKRRGGKWGEDLQDRIELSEFGPVTIEVRNWSGAAAAALNLDVVPAPIPSPIAWSIVTVIILLGLVVEVRYGCSELTPDLALLSSYGVFLRDGVTPLDDLQEVAFAVAPAFLFAYLFVYGGTWLTVRYVNSRSQAIADKNNPPPPPEPKDGTKRRRNRRSSRRQPR